VPKPTHLASHFGNMVVYVCDGILPPRGTYIEIWVRHGKVLVRSRPQIGISSQKRTFAHRTPPKKRYIPVQTN